MVDLTLPAVAIIYCQLEDRGVERGLQLKDRCVGEGQQISRVVNVWNINMGGDFGGGGL